ncbi:MAG: choice-of-anchor L domain-containing protein [Polyangiaceae bacterium]
MKQRLPWTGAGILSMVALVASCDDGTTGAGGSDSTGSKSTGATMTSTSSASMSTSSNGGAASSSAAQFMTGSTGAGGTCNAGPDEDKDGDGYTINQGDCNDCDANVNPNAVEVKITEPDPMTGMVPEPADEDCDTMIDNVAPPCDAGLAADGTAEDAARAIEICKTSSDVKHWGLVQASYVRANGNPYGTQEPLQHGILANFGTFVGPRAGERLVALSSGRARLPGQAGAATGRNMKSKAGSPPPAFPQAVMGCAGGTTINDDVALQVVLRAPSNATGYKFDFRFNTFEYPQWICTKFNDQFIALVDPPPMGAVNGNISFDSKNNPVSVNIAFFDVCATCMNYAQNCMGTCPMAPNPCCPSTAMDLTGTGFENSFVPNGETGGGTTWLQTQAPIGHGDEFLIRFSIWDTGDQNLDSTAIVDNFQWIANGGTVKVETMEPPQ